jgi:hypothetical protein
VNLPTWRSLSRAATFGCLTCLMMTGCTAAWSTAPRGQWVSEWSARLPTTRSPIEELAFGAPGTGSGPGAYPESDALAAVDDALQPTMTQKRRPLHKQSYRRVAPPKPIAIASAKLSEPVAPDASDAPSQDITPVPAAATDSEQLAVNDAGARYADREQQAKEQQQFRGGDAIIISAGALLVVLLIVILVLLLR